MASEPMIMTSHRPSLLLRAIITLQFVGGAGILLIVTTAYLSRQVRRHATWYSFCCSWIIAVVSYTLLTFAGQQTGPEPDYNVCLVQSGLIYAAPVLTSSSTMTLVVQLWVSLNQQQTSETVPRSKVPALVLLVFPYVAWIGVFAGSLVFGITHPHDVQRARSCVYCINASGIPGKVSASVVLIVMVTTITLEVFLAVRIYRRRNTYKNGTQHAPHLSLTTALRTGIFTLVGVFSIVVSLVFVSESNFNGDLSNVFIAMMPLAAFLIFGTQTDILNAWHVRVYRKAPTGKPLPPLPTAVEGKA